MAFRLANKDRLLAPRKCLICETTPQHRVVDTGYNLTRNSVAELLRGRKYVCAACGEKIGKALGMLNSVEVGKVKDALIREQNRNAELQEMTDLAAEVAALREKLDVPAVSE